MRFPRPVVLGLLLTALAVAPSAVADQVLFDEDVELGGDGVCVRTAYLMELRCWFSTTLAAPANNLPGTSYRLRAEWVASHAEYRALNLRLTTHNDTTVFDLGGPSLHRLENVGYASLSGPSPLAVELLAGVGENGLRIGLGLDPDPDAPVAVLPPDDQQVRLRLEFIG